MDRLPIIDISGLRTGDPADKAAVAAEIGDACRRIGFFYVTGHGVPQPLIDATFKTAKEFFRQPDAVKQATHVKNTPYFRGWEPPGEQTLDAAAKPDLKESFLMGPDLGPDHPEVAAGTPHYGPNQWPEMPGFKVQMEAYFDALLVLSRTIGRGIALSLDLAEDYFDTVGEDSMSILRLLHYPPHPPDADDRTFGAGTHTDWGFLTVLAQDDAGGLQVRRADGTWIDAPPVAGAYVINLGDMTARWTNDCYRSTPHRVVNRSGRERQSIPFFYDLNFHARVECLPACQSPENPPKYPPTTAGEHILEMYAKTYGSHA